MLRLDGLLPSLQETAAFRCLLDQLSHALPTPDQHLIRAARPYLIAALASALNRPTLVITGTVERAYSVTEQLPVWLPTTPTLRFAEPSALFYDRSPWASNAIRSRLAALTALCPPIGVERGAPVIISSALALMARTLPSREFKAASRALKIGARVEQDKLLRMWLSIGYTPTNIVVEAGTFARRGGVVDIFPISATQPARIEFFGDEIESIRGFDAATQRSTAPLERLIIAPAREALPKFGPSVLTKLSDWFAQQPDPSLDVASALPDARDLATESAFPTMEFYLPYFYSSTASLLDFAPPETLVIVDDWQALEETIASLEAQAVDLYTEKTRANQLPPHYPLPYFTWEELRDEIRARQTIHLAGSRLEAEVGDEPSVVGDLFAAEAHHGGQLKPFLDALRAIERQSARPIVVSNQAQRLAELWSEQVRGKRPAVVAGLPEAPHQTTFVEGALAEGWAFKPTSGMALHLLTDAEIFGWRRPEPRRHVTPRALSPEAYFADLQPGDFVVHLEYGVGKFLGLQKRLLDGSEREYLIIQYAGTDTLYVPIHQADRVSRYIGADDKSPQLTRLGSAEWQNHKEAGRRAAEEVAKEMLELYAKRATVQGYAFGPDTPWQAELEASFPYIETEDQLKALSAVKADMERPYPMDRLICGDVGFGKTEVALRAAFKAVMDGKQVAMLVPTTVLAQQHYNTFSQRLAAFPLRVEMLSRFRSPREQSEIIGRTARGEVDILIGTHRILQEDVSFKDLGLMIIDEEQRFGVTHKERFKRLRTEIDVLTMTATPIPRTLYMSLTGIRDISMIQTPPAERLPVLTYVGSYDEKVVRQAILRELDRGGQIYFVHNRVATIHNLGDHLARLVPEAKILIGHGQMHEDELERVMIRFANGEADILLCTTIIESGLDIPNANTIIIDRADTFGLAQLYQLRGRVGRGAYRAYAYLFYHSGAALTAEARARLETIAEQTELGAGLSIAMRDLEIRGIGELLGYRQSGYIAAVGFNLYTQMLSNAVNQLKREQPTSEAAPPRNGISAPVTIDLPVAAYVPVDFVNDSAMRLQFYRRLADLHTVEAVDEMQAELEDRFGELPPPLEGLLFQMRVKLLAQLARVTAVVAESGQIAVKLPYLAEVDRGALQRHLANEVRVSRTAVWIAVDDENEWRQRLLNVLERLKLQPKRQRLGV